jgi:hypothetical protein
MSSAQRPQGQLKAEEANSNIEHMSHLDIYCDPMTIRKTGIICTIGAGGSFFCGVLCNVQKKQNQNNTTNTNSLDAG